MTSPITSRITAETTRLLWAIQARALTSQASVLTGEISVQCEAQAERRPRSKRSNGGQPPGLVA